MSSQEITGIIFLSFVALYLIFLFIVFIFEYLKKRDFPKHFVFIQRLGNSSIYYSKRTKCVYSVSKDGKIKIIHERYVGDTDEN